MSHSTAVVMHHYENNDLDRENLDYFLKHGINQNSDFYFSVVGDANLPFPTLPNVNVIECKNRDMDYGGISHVLKERIIPCGYQSAIILNSTVRGPYQRSDGGVWQQRFLSLLKGDIHLVGAAISVLHPTSPHAADFNTMYSTAGAVPHAQSMAYGISKDALEYLNQEGFYDQSFESDRNKIICGYELLMSHLILRRGWNISCLLHKYRDLDYRSLTVDPNPTSSGGDALFRGAYFGESVQPAEGLFVKVRRHYADF
jgi:hypothetical protein